MDAATLYRAGKLDEAIEAAGDQLRQNPMDGASRTVLFELLLFAGEFDRAEKQLDVLARANSDAEMGAWLYRSALHADRIRQEMFDTGSLPAGGVDPTPPAGALNGADFASLTDADPRIGARLELLAAGQYTWIPFEQIDTIRIEPPRRLRDLVWIPAQVTVAPEYSGTDLGEVLIPALTPGAGRQEDDEVRLGRVTDWVELGPDQGHAPMGQKLLLVDDEPFPLLEVRELRIARPATDED